MTNAGVLVWPDVSTAGGVRPALHLNLTQAEAASAQKFAVPTEVTTEYNGAAQDVGSVPTPDWYDPANMSIVYGTNTNMMDVGTYSLNAHLTATDTRVTWNDETRDDQPFNFVITKKQAQVVFTQSTTGGAPTVDYDYSTVAIPDVSANRLPQITLHYKKKGTSGESTTVPTAPGTYVARASIPDNANYELTGTVEEEFTVTMQSVQTPVLGISSTPFPYTGSPQTFSLSNYNPTDVELKLPSGVTESNNHSYLSVTEAGSYEIKAHIRDFGNKTWDNGGIVDKSIGTIVIGKVDASVVITNENGDPADPSGNPIVTCSQGDQPKMEIAAGTKGSDKIRVNIYATPTTGGTKTLVTTGVSTGSTPTQFTIDTSRLRAGNYAITAEITADTDEQNKNYNLVASAQNPVLGVSEQTKDVNVLWRLTHGNTKDTHSAGKNQSETFAKTLTYDGKAFIWKVDSALLMLNGYKIDTTFGVNGYVDDRKTDSGTYKTQVRIVSTASGVSYSEVFEINWTVNKAKFDLSGVNWKGNGSLEYNGRMQTMELENLPAGLTATIGGQYQAMDVASGMNASVLSFDVSDKANYIEPDPANASTYLNPNGKFQPSVSWSIVPAQIKVQWGKEAKTSTNGEVFNALVLRDGNYRSVVNETYYKSDASGNISDRTPVNINVIAVPTSGVDYYVCEVTLAGSDGNYVLTGSTVSPAFAVRDMGKAAKFTPTTTTFQYIGSAINVQFTNDAGLKTSDYTVKYYTSDGSPLTSTPSAVGKYRVGVELNSDIAGTYFIAGADNWDYEIKARVIAENWNTGVKPPRLQINRTEAGLIEYEMIDDSGNAVTFGSLKAGNYQIRAKIKSAYAGSISFPAGATETDWQSFEIKTADVPQDPSDPSNYPEDPDNPNKPGVTPGGDTPGGNDNPGGGNNPGGDGSGNGDGNGGSGVDLSKIPLWQLIVGGVSVVLLAAFTGKTASNVSQKKKYDKKAKKAEAKTFSFAGMTLLSLMWGMEETWWTVIACSLLGLAVMMFFVMLVTGSQRKKAEEACEEAEASAERRRLEVKEEKEQRRLEEERRKRDEDMKMMLMMMNNRGGNSGEESYGYSSYGSAPADVETIVTHVISGLLPTIQGMLPAPSQPQVTVVDNSEELAALREEIKDLKEGLSTPAPVPAPAPQVVERIIVKKSAAEEDEDDEDWADNDEEDFYEEVSEEGDLVEEAAPATEARTRLPLNFRVRLKASSEKNHNAYVEIKNLLNSYKGISFRMSGRTEKVKYQGEVIAIIGVARKSLKLWLALNPFAYDEKRYHQKDASEKVSYAQTPMLVRVGSERALKRVSELIGELMTKFSVEQRKKYVDKDLQVLAYTLKRNALLKAKKTDLLRGSIHVHDTDVLTNEEALEYLEQKERGAIGKENFATVSLDTLEENFFDGQKVTLDKLKKKGLVPEDCNGYRVTAGERLTKPLFVVADEFSTSAVKMFILTGGRAVQLFDPFAKK